MTSGSATAHAAVWTDQADYSPGSVVTITGDNSDGAGYQPGETVDVAVNGPGSITKACSATADSSGAWSCQIMLGTGSAAVGSYTYTATGESSNVSQSGTFTDSACPNTVGTRPTDPNVTASYTTSGGTATYSIGTPNESQISTGIPGLIEYCVYTSPLPGSPTALYGDWKSGVSNNFFDFERSGGDPDNLPFNGSTQMVGYATWSSVPASQTILLHINDPTECQRLYGAGSSATCFVLPGSGANQDLVVTKTATPSFTRTYTWNIQKLVDKTEIDIAEGGSATFNYTVGVSHDTGTDGNWQVSGTIKVTNPNVVDFNGVNVTDAIDNNGKCLVNNGTGATIPAGQSTTFDYTCTYTAAPNPASGTNTATATWDASTYHTPDGTASGIAPYDFGSVTPTIVDGSVTVTDTAGGKTTTLGTVKYTDPSPTTLTYPITFSGDAAGTCTTHDNTATFTTDTTNTTGSDSKTVTVCVGADLTVSKTANPSFTRTYNWDIKKSADKTMIDPGGTVNYTVVVTEGGFTDSNSKVSGTITVYNPNDWESISASVTDAIDNGGTCAITGMSGVTILPLGSMQLPYTCTYSSAPSPASGTNTATASWDKVASFTPDGSAIGTAPADFGSVTPTPVHKTVTVTDTQGGTLGTVTATDTTPYTTQTFTYKKTFSPPASGCTTVNNTATIVETGQTASAAVKDCNSGALTMGYWQNKNGQAIITTGASTSGVCNSATWLRQYAPFQDLSSTATCKQVAAYVYNVIKLANASGSSMNAMLKAQMLATSLDVHFSNPAVGFGGNKIGAPAPIGGLTIDLTHVCHMIDSSNGTATCSGTYENASSAFGGANSLTVSQMLGYAASQSPVGGTTWYGNVKATQQLAKDAFDAINNQVATSP